MTPFPRPQTVPEVWLRAPLGPHALRFVRTQRFDRPIGDVATFFADAGHLEHIAPPWLRLTYIDPRDTPIISDQRLNYRVHMFGLPFHWRTRILHAEPATLAYEQERGPCASWRHLYDYLPDGDGTLLVDSIEYELPLGRAGVAARALFAHRIVQRMLDVRADRLRGLLQPL